MDKIGKRMIASGRIMQDRTWNVQCNDIRILRITKFGYAWRIVMVDGLVSEIEKIEALEGGI